MGPNNRVNIVREAYGASCAFDGFKINAKDRTVAIIAV